jgi:hypothetical protein
MNTFQIAEDYTDAESLFLTLHAQFKASTHVSFHGTFPIEEDNLVKPKEQTHMLAKELWKITGYRFMLVLLSRTFFWIKTHLIGSVHDNLTTKRRLLHMFLVNHANKFSKNSDPDYISLFDGKGTFPEDSEFRKYIKNLPAGNVLEEVC